MTDIFAGVFILAGSLFLCLAGLTLLRFPDLLTRLSASTKAVTFGAGLVFVAVAIFFHDVATDARAVAGILFFGITAPVAGTVIARGAMRVGVPVWHRTVVEEAAMVIATPVDPEPEPPADHKSPEIQDPAT